MKNTAKEVLSDISGYSVEELKDRCTEILIQPYDAELTAVKYAAQEVAERNTEIERMLRLALEESKTNGHYKDGAMSPRNAVHHAIANIIGTFCWQPLPTPPQPKEKELSNNNKED